MTSISTRTPEGGAALPELPRLIHQRLLAAPAAADHAIKALATAQKSRNGWLALIAVLLAGVIVALVWRQLR